LHIDH